MKRQDASFQTPYQMVNSLQRDPRGRFLAGNEESYLEKETWERYGFIVINEQELPHIPDTLRCLIKTGYIAITNSFLFEMHRIVNTDIVHISSRDFNIPTTDPKHLRRLWIFPPQYREQLIGINRVPLEPDDGVSNRK